LPLSTNNPFIDYLRADDPDYRRDFELREKTVFENGIENVLADNSELNGLWLITGANNGIGFAPAQCLCAKGYGKKPFLVDKNMQYSSKLSGSAMLSNQILDVLNSGLEFFLAPSAALGTATDLIVKRRGATINACYKKVENTSRNTAPR